MGRGAGSGRGSGYGQPGLGSAVSASLIGLSGLFSLSVEWGSVFLDEPHLNLVTCRKGDVRAQPPNNGVPGYSSGGFEFLEPRRRVPCSMAHVEQPISQKSLPKNSIHLAARHQNKWVVSQEKSFGASCRRAQRTRDGIIPAPGPGPRKILMETAIRLPSSVPALGITPTCIRQQEGGRGRRTTGSQCLCCASFNEWKRC